MESTESELVDYTEEDVAVGSPQPPTGAVASTAEAEAIGTGAPVPEGAGEVGVENSGQVPNSGAEGSPIVGGGVLNPPGVAEGTGVNLSAQDIDMAASAPAGNDASSSSSSSGSDNEARVEVAGRSYPPPSAFDALDPYGTDDTSKYTMAKAPWFERDAVLTVSDKLAAAGEGVVDVEDDFDPYLDGRDFFPGDIPRNALGSWTWRHAYSIRDRDLRRDGNRPVGSLREDYVAACMRGLGRFLSVEEVDEEVSDLFVYRTRGERAYVQALQEIPQGTIDGWANGEHAHADAVLFPRPLLAREFRYLRKRCDFIIQQVAEEKSLSTIYSMCVPYHMPQASLMNRDARRAA